MKVIAINGSPRKEWNTAMLLEKTLDGAASKGADTELVHLYDLNYKGCISCFACKRKGGASYGRCALRDDLNPVFERIEAADALVFGSPIYLGAATGEMRSFLERLLFQYLVYDGNYSTLFPKKISVGFIYTFGADDARLKEMGYEQHLALMGNIAERLLGATTEMLLVTDTYQFDDYDKYVSHGFDPVHKAKRRKEVFPVDCQRAFDMGVRLVAGKV